MSDRKKQRRLAMQILYQVDLRADDDFGAIVDNFDNEFDTAETLAAAATLAQAAWQTHGDADAAITKLAPKWPTHRQPPVDRAILRLAYHEMVSGHAPVTVAINEAVNLAKQYCAEKSPAFVNGVLDKMAKMLRTQGLIPETKAHARSDDWLNDALEDKPDTTNH